MVLLPQVKGVTASVTAPRGVCAQWWGHCGAQSSLCTSPFCVSLMSGCVPEQTDGITHRGIIRSSLVEAKIYTQHFLGRGGKHYSQTPEGSSQLLPCHF